MFKFNFQPHQDNYQCNELEVSKSEKEKKSEDAEIQLVLRPFSKHKVTERHFHFVKNLHPSQVKETEWKGILNLKHIKLEGLDQSIQGVKETTHLHSDLIPAVYEGGFKIWECTWELLSFIQRTGIEFRSRRVLELGCGAGLLGIAAAVGGASHVTFQDYNEEVLNRLTIPNAVLNLSTILPEVELSTSTSEDLEQAFNDKLQFISGDWSILPHRMEDQNLPKHLCDLILTSETIYNPQNYPKLIQVFKECLSPDGEVLLASKSHYFGVGGGTYEFCCFLRSQKRFEIVAETCEGHGVQKEILKIKKMKD